MFCKWFFAKLFWLSKKKNQNSEKSKHCVSTLSKFYLLFKFTFCINISFTLFKSQLKTFFKNERNSNDNKKVLILSRHILFDTKLFWDWPETIFLTFQNYQRTEKAIILTALFISNIINNSFSFCFFSSKKRQSCLLYKIDLICLNSMAEKPFKCNNKGKGQLGPKTNVTVSSHCFFLFFHYAHFNMIVEK